MIKITTPAIYVKPRFADWLDKSATLRLKRRGAELVGPCPLCGGRDRFSVKKIGGGDAVFYCRHCQPDRGNAAAFSAILEAAGFAKQRRNRRTSRPKKPPKPVRQIIATGGEPEWYAAELESLRLHVRDGTARRGRRAGLATPGREAGPGMTYHVEELPEIPRLLTLEELIAQAEAAPSWFLDGMLTGDGLSLLCGNPKTGKSTFARSLARAAVRGTEFLGRLPVKGSAVLVTLEDSARKTAAHLQEIGARARRPALFRDPQANAGQPRRLGNGASRLD